MYYRLKATVRYTGLRPTRTKIQSLEDRERGFDAYVLAGSLADKPFNVTAGWIDRPHLELVNLPVVSMGNWRQVESKAMQTFTEKYGVLRGTFPQEIEKNLNLPVKPSFGYPQIIPVRTDYRVDHPEWAKELPEPRFYINSGEFSEAQSLLRQAWAGDGNAVKQIHKEAVTPGPYYPVALEIQPSVERGVVELQTRDLWNFICLLFLLDCAQGKTKICRNRDCSAPYFIQTRKDQQYCSHKCAVLINVRRFLARQETKREPKAELHEARHVKSNRRKS